MSWPYAVRRAADYCLGISPEDISTRLRNSSFVNVERRYMYFEVPKAGCTSMKWLLHSIEGMPPIRHFGNSQWEARREMFIHDRANLRIPSLLDLDDPTQEFVLTSPEFMRFTVVRNPYTRVESAWRDKVRLCAPWFGRYTMAIRGKLPTGKDPTSLVSFREFVTWVSWQDAQNCDHHWRLQAAHTCRGALNFSHVGRLEDFSSTVRAFLTHLRATERQQERAMNITTPTSEYDEEIAKAVYGIYREDFEAFSYAEDDWVKAPGDSHPRVVPESVFIDEVLERNIVINALYEERATLKHGIHESGQGLRSASVLENCLRREKDPLLLSRYKFHLAQCYLDQGKKEKALELYEERARLGFWDQEVFISLYRSAKLKADLGYNDEAVIATYLKAHDVCSNRAEALHGASRFCRIKQRYEQGLELARRALHIKRPDDALFFEGWIYDYGVLEEYAVNAYWLGQYDECLNACRTILASKMLSEDGRRRIQTNADFALQKLGTLGLQSNAV
jgi:tetratricopeptide (TPR) repeat protein